MGCIWSLGWCLDTLVLGVHLCNSWGGEEMWDGEEMWVCGEKFLSRGNVKKKLRQQFSLCFFFTHLGSEFVIESGALLVLCCSSCPLLSHKGCSCLWTAVLYRDTWIGIIQRDFLIFGDVYYDLCSFRWESISCYLFVWLDFYLAFLCSGLKVANNIINKNT